MRSTLSILTLLFTLFISGIVFSQPCTMQGVYKIGPTGNYPALTAALSALRTTGVGNNVILELQAGYSGAGEIFPLRFKNIPCIDSLKNITIRPEAGATTRTISSGNAIATIDLDSSRGEFFLTAKGLINKKIKIDVLNNFGQIIYKADERVLINDYSRMINLKKMADGMYYIRITVGNKVYLRKIIKAN